MQYCFYPAMSGKTFDGGTLKTEPLGGSETAVVYMARELAKLGHEVVVFSRGEPGMYDDVLYLPFESARTFLLLNPVDVLVCSRDSMPMLWNHRATCTVYWAHDVPQGPIPENYNLYFFVSQWQAQLYAQYGYIPKDQNRVRVTPNGIDLTLFTARHMPDELIPESPVNLVWTSNPERGLWYAGELVQRVREYYPNAQLHVLGRNSVYGWDNSHEHVYYPYSLEGLVFHEAMNKAELAEFLPTMDLLVYPTWWHETFCIATLEAQAAGLPVVASGLGALPETVRGGVLVPGTVGTPEHMDAFTAETLSLLESRDKRLQLSDAGLAWAQQFDWSGLAKRWSELFSHALGYVA